MFLQRLVYKFSRNTRPLFISPKIKYCHKPIIEGQYGVLPARIVPSYIVRPDYVDNPNPVYGIYEGEPVKHDKEMIKKLTVAGNLAARTLSHAAANIQAGMTTEDVDRLVHEFIIANDAYPTPIGFMEFPKSVCTSVNEDTKVYKVCCHGIPDLRPLENGDYMNIDVTVFKGGVHGDSSLMIQIGETHPDIKKLINVTQQILYESIKLCKPGVPFSKIGETCDAIASDNGFVVCELFTGHGVGKLLHMPPMIIHHQNDYPGRMEPGNVFTIEPIILMRHGEYYMWKDNFTTISPDNPSAQWEHTILITETGYEVLTLREGEKIE